MNIPESSPTAIQGCKEISGVNHIDDRGLFFRIAEEKWLPSGYTFKEISGAINPRANTFRGLHYERTLEKEYKIVRVIEGRLLDILLDLRPSSTTYLKHTKFILDSKNPKSIFIPPGVAHGYLTLEPDTTIIYSMTEEFSRESYQGIRFDDSAFGIDLPSKVEHISEQDSIWPPWRF